MIKTYGSSNFLDNTRLSDLLAVFFVAVYFVKTVTRFTCFVNGPLRSRFLEI